MSTAPRRPSMGDVAARAGVSYQTVSRVLNEPGIVRPDTRDRVLAAIADLGYARNRAARALKTSRSSLIGVLTDGSSLFGPAETTTAVEIAAREAGYSVLLTSMPPGGQGADQVGAELLGSGVDGILVIAAHAGMDPAVGAVAQAAPVVAISAQTSAEAGVEVVGIDQGRGACEVVAHLRRTGVRSVVHLAGPPDWFDARARRCGFEAAVTAEGLDAEVLGSEDWTPRSGYELTLQVLERGRPEAIFAANDMMAIGVLHALHERGLRIPEDVAVVGFDNTLGAEFLLPSLTTVAQPFAEVGRAALGHLVELMDGATEAAETPRALPPRLVVRRSTRPERTH
ncbi:LacI family transcriptional regulator [Brachybacterium sp. SGAir0954]|uniref:LacI family DNA-binding transcriptional regulator n=1 Tax=Brachybacterium sp. SGAir0954 TaxID=2571029 RepID=UPI0010CCFCB1|nr:LacI family DNA-binding transcriptional regulator [Brachybacterium sp. SGAir0954]QCR52869.1 LacI family transcriptional regulator [Brachybacterium sp. SGAir0954]